MEVLKKRLRETPGRLRQLFKRRRVDEDDRPSTPTPRVNSLLKRIRDTPGKVWSRIRKRQRPVTEASPRSVRSSILRVVRPTWLFGQSTQSVAPTDERPAGPSPAGSQSSYSQDDRPITPSPIRPSTILMVTHNPPVGPSPSRSTTPHSQRSTGRSEDQNRTPSSAEPSTVLSRRHSHRIISSSESDSNVPAPAEDQPVNLSSASSSQRQSVDVFPLPSSGSNLVPVPAPRLTRADRRRRARLLRKSKQHGKKERKRQRKELKGLKNQMLKLERQRVTDWRRQNENYIQSRDRDMRVQRLQFSPEQDLRLSAKPPLPPPADRPIHMDPTLEIFWDDRPEFHPGALSVYKTSLKSLLWETAPHL